MKGTVEKKEKEAWRRVDDEHPLVEATITSGGSTFSSSTAALSRPSIDTALLLQSAARSVLDSDAMTSPSNASDVSSPHGTPSLGLASLRRERLPAMPDEQDRKRFIGCLAAVLASSYDFDVIEEGNGSANDALEAEYLAFDEDDDVPSSEIRRPQNHSLQGTVTGDLQSADSFGDFSTSSNASSPGKRRRNKVHLSRKHHRKQRYDVLSRLLLSSAEYLLLEKHQAKAFLPMLSQLFAPRPKHPEQSFNSPSRRKASGRHASVSPSADPSVLEAIQNVAIDGFESRDSDIANRLIDEIDHLRPFLDSMTPGGGFRCLALVMLQHLMQSREGYDARVRQALKMLGVIILYRDMHLDHASDIASDVRESRTSDLVTLATRRFESLEHFLAVALLKISKEQEKGAGKAEGKSKTGKGDSKGYSRDQIVRGIKVGAMGVAAAGLFAVTGGLAAPGIAAGVAAIPGLAASAAAATTVLTSTAAVTAIFGVGGGTLVAYKMNRRTMGLTEFEFRKETEPSIEKNDDHVGIEAELFTTICISGWLRDECDFQRPWGVSPANPWIKDRQELLERFYSVYRPDHVVKSKKILKSWEGEEDELWRLLRQKYGRDPDHLYPLEGGPREDGELTLDQREVVEQLFVELGYSIKRDKKRSSVSSRLKFGWNRRNVSSVTSGMPHASAVSYPSMDSLHGPNRNQTSSMNGMSSIESSSLSQGIMSNSTHRDDGDGSDEVPKHIDTVWDYKRHYGGELYTIRWESELLQDLCESVKDLAYEMVHRGTQQILKHTALSALLSAIAWPAVLVNAANMIDGTWTLAVERADEAGKELARSLLFSSAGHRPVTLVGFSFGARAIYSCLKEMAKYQEKWYKYQDEIQNKNGRSSRRASQMDSDDTEPLSEMREPASIIEDVVIMGLPNHLSIASWKACRQVVSGRLINCFSQKDLILSLMFQFKRLGLKPVCGTLPVSVPGVENFDVSDLVSAHQDYCTATGDILKRVRLGEPFRSKPTRFFDPEIGSSDGGTMADKFDV